MSGFFKDVAATQALYDSKSLSIFYGDEQSVLICCILLQY